VNILVVDDQRSARAVLHQILSELADVSVFEAESLERAQSALVTQSIDMMLLDIRLSEDPTDRGGLELLRWARAQGHKTPAVMITSATEIAHIREAMRSGAQDYVLKDELSPEMLLPIVESIRERLNLRGEVARLRQKVQGGWGTDAIIGRSMALEQVRKLIERMAASDAPVLIRGETGTGKELVARAIHETSSRCYERFLALNCSALPGTLVESMIFGHERGAFTGAERRVRGHLELAGGGTLLLDEIAEMAIELQAKLLRVLEERKFQPLGSEESVPLRARVLASSHADLERRIALGTFREDLFYRLNVLCIQVPPLRDRMEDFPDLLQAFLAQQTRSLHFSEDAIRWFQDRPWPGNVRELKNAIERLATVSEKDEIDLETVRNFVGLPGAFASIEVSKMARAILALPARLGSKLDVIELAVFQHAMEACEGNKSAAARLVGLDRKSFERRLGRLSDPNLEPVEPDKD
jgi:DNA-binding NtrC family response regulator